MSDQPVFSIGPGSQSSTKKKDKEPKAKKYAPGNSSGIVLSVERKKRGGKSVTICSNLPFDESSAKELLKELKQKVACGGALKNSCLELSGDNRQACREYFIQKGIKVKN